MKFIQKMLASLFAILLMVTVITPNYFGLAKADEDTVLLSYSTTEDSVSVNMSELYGAISAKDESTKDVYYLLNGTQYNSFNKAKKDLEEANFLNLLKRATALGNVLLSSKILTSVSDLDTELEVGEYYAVYVSIFGQTTFKNIDWSKIISSANKPVVTETFGKVIVTKKIATEMEISDSVSVDYDYAEDQSSLKAKIIAEALANGAVTVTGSDEANIALKVDDLSLDNLSVTSEEQEVLLTYKGNDDYAGCSEKLTVKLNMVEVKGENFGLSKRYEFGEKTKIEKAILNGVNASLNIGSIDSYEVTSVQFETANGIYRDIDTFALGLNAHKFGANPITPKVPTSENWWENISDGINNIVNNDVWNVPEEWVVDNTENVRIKYAAKDGVAGPEALTLDVVVTITEDDRTPLKFTVDDVVVTYDEFDEDFVFDAVMDNLHVAEDINRDLFKLAEGQNHLNAGKRVVTLMFMAPVDDDVNGSNAVDVNVTVRKATGKVDAKSEKFEYNGKPAELKVKVDPEKSEEISNSVVKLVVGVDGEASGFASLFIPESLKNQLSFNLFGQKIDAYEILTKTIQDGVKLGDLKGVIIDIKNGLEIINNANNPNLDMIISALETIEKLPTVNLKAMVYLDKAPTDVGAYAFVAVSTAPNYNISVDVADVIITPNRNAVLNWNEKLPDRHVFTYEDMMDDFGGFDFGAHAHLNGSEEKTTDHVNTIFAGLDTNLRPMVEVNSADKITMPGIYTETAATIGGNYFANPISRVFIVSREKTKTVAENKTVTYNGVAQSVGYEVKCTSGSHENLSEKATVIYTRNGLPVTNPIYAGTYRAYVYYPGDATHEPSYDYATLTIEQAKVGINFEADNAVYDGNQHGATNVVAVVEKDGEWVEDGDITSRLTITYTSALGTPFYYSSEAPTEAGTYYVTVSYAGDRNHTKARAVGKFVIEKAEVVITATEVEAYYDGEGHGVNYIVTCNGGEACEKVKTVVDENVKYTDPNNNNTFTNPTGILPVDAGTYEVEIGYPGDRNHKAVRPVSTKVVILPAEVEVTLNSTNAVYGEEPVLTYSAEVVKGKGEYDVTKLNVTPFVIKGTQSVTVGDSNHTVSAVDSYPNVGTYQIWASRLSDKNVNVTMKATLADGTVVATDSEYLLNTMATLTITPKKVNVVVGGQTKYVGEKDPELTWKLDENTPMAYGEETSELNVVLSRLPGENVGSYQIEGAWDNDNYEVSFTEAFLRIREKVSAPTTTYVVPNTATK